MEDALVYGTIRRCEHSSHTPRWFQVVETGTMTTLESAAPTMEMDIRQDNLAAWMG